jgi:hypothetical protein
MNDRNISIELTGEMDLEIQWAYYHTPGCYSGPYENSYPEETEVEVILPPDTESQLRSWAENMIPLWMEQIEKARTELEDSVPGWAEEAWQDYQSDRAEYLYEASKDR